ncbi:unnamed protein product [Nesidiocoris tenuis]|uniref:Uncharacterized protein n=1 Tax=Nesidiocoris tenuis TaxID=355587 RepID=A0A6H5H0K7_9HEMI|nr:unnamed protein product [Nesidiocoris tenuis]
MVGTQKCQEQDLVQCPTYEEFAGSLSIAISSNKRCKIYTSVDNNCSNSRDLTKQRRSTQSIGEDERRCASCDVIQTSCDAHSHPMKNGKAKMKDSNVTYLICRCTRWVPDRGISVQRWRTIARWSH